MSVYAYECGCLCVGVYVNGCAYICVHVCGCMNVYVYGTAMCSWMNAFVCASVLICEPVSAKNIFYRSYAN